MTPAFSHSLLHRQFGRFLNYVAATATAFGAAELLAGVLLDSQALTAVGASMIVLVLGLLLARWVLGRRSAEAAGAVASLTFLVTPVLFVAAFQALLPVGVFFLMAACSLPMIFRSRRYFLLATACTVLTSLLLAAVSLMPPALPPPEPWIAAIFMLSNLPVCTALMALLFYFIWLNFSASIDLAEQSNGELRGLQATLSEQVAERTGALATAVAELQARSDAQASLLAENERQRDMIRNLSVPVLPIGAGTLVIPLVGMLDGERLETLLSRALEAIAGRPTRRLVLDITGVPMIDQAVAEGLARVPAAARLLGAEVVLVGISPEVAQTVVGLGLDLVGLRTASTLQEAMGGGRQTLVMR